MTVMYADLEEKSVPAFALGTGLVLAQGSTTGQTTQQQQVQQSQLGGQVQQQGQVPSTQRGSFQMAMAGL